MTKVWWEFSWVNLANQRNSPNFNLPISYLYIFHFWLLSKFAKPSSINLIQNAIHQTKVPQNFCHLWCRRSYQKYNIIAMQVVVLCTHTHRRASCVHIRKKALLPIAYGGWLNEEFECLHSCLTGYMVLHLQDQDTLYAQKFWQWF